MQGRDPYGFKRQSMSATKRLGEVMAVYWASSEASLESNPLGSPRNGAPYLFEKVPPALKPLTVLARAGV
jgi:hypothetical protein